MGLQWIIQHTLFIILHKIDCLYFMCASPSTCWVPMIVELNRISFHPIASSQYLWFCSTSSIIYLALYSSRNSCKTIINFRRKFSLFVLSHWSGCCVYVISIGNRQHRWILHDLWPACGFKALGLMPYSLTVLFSHTHYCLPHYFLMLWNISLDPLLTYPAVSVSLPHPHEFCVPRLQLVVFF